MVRRALTVTYQHYSISHLLASNTGACDMAVRAWVIAAARMTQRVLLAAAMLAPLAARAQEPPTPIVFNPALNAAQDFRVSYRVNQSMAGSAEGSREVLGVAYHLRVTATARVGDGYRLRFKTSEAMRSGSPQAMDMVVAAALMLDGVDVDILVDARGFPTEVIDWPSVQRTLQRRANGLPGPFAGIGHSVVDERTSKQATWVLFPAFEAMNRARSYYDFAKQTGSSTISWYGSPIDVTIAPADANGAIALSWVSPAAAGANWSSKADAMLRKDGFVSRMTVVLRESDVLGRRRDTTAIEAVTPP
jgi:hypothetical protein